MRSIKKYIVLIFFVLLTVTLFSFEEPIFEGIRSGIDLSVNTVIPSLFPFMIISKLAMSADILRPLRRPLSAASRFLFRLPSPCADILIFSLIGGYPIGAVLAKESLDRGEITPGQLRSIMRFCIIGGPGFIIGGIGRCIFKSTQAGIIIYISCVLSAILCGVISGRVTEYTPPVVADNTSFVPPFCDSLVDSVASSCRGLLTVCSYVVIFSALNSAIAAFDIPQNLYTLISAPLEVTGGSAICAFSGGVPLTAALVAFGGIAIHCQIFSLLRGQIKIHDFMIFRVLSASFAYLFSKLIMAVYSPAVATVAAGTVGYSPALQSGIWSLLLVPLCVFMIISSGKEKEKIDFTCRL